MIWNREWIMQSMANWKMSIEMISGAAGMWGQGGENYLLAMLQRSPSALTQIAKTFGESGTSEARFTLDGSTRDSLCDHFSPAEMGVIRQHSMDVGVLCKACQTLYGNEAAILQHQRAGCPVLAAEASSNQVRGATRLILVQHECVQCEDKCPTLSELRNHFNSDQHRHRSQASGDQPPATGGVAAAAGGAGGAGSGVPPRADNSGSPANATTASPNTDGSPSAGLSSQIEDVVKQLTALAQATGGTPMPMPSFGAHGKNSDCDTNANIARKAATYGQ